MPGAQYDLTLPSAHSSPLSLNYYQSLTIQEGVKDLSFYSQCFLMAKVIIWTERNHKVRPWKLGLGRLCDQAIHRGGSRSRREMLPYPGQTDSCQCTQVETDWLWVSVKSKVLFDLNSGWPWRERPSSYWSCAGCHTLRYIMHPINNC